MTVGNMILGLVAAVAVGSAVFSMLALFWATRKRTGLADHAPAVTIFKPLKGLDEGLEDNLRSFFRLDYPEFQLVFGVADQDDAAIPVVERLLAEFPERDACLVVGAAPYGLNPKVENLASMMRQRRHDVILISDSNVRVRPEYLRETACYLADPSVGLVTNVFVGVGEKQLGATLENLQLNGFISGAVGAATAMGATCVIGKSMLMPIRVLDAVGGLASVRNLLAEDQAIGLRVRKAGYSIRLSHHVVENVNHRRDLKWFLNRHSRWYKIRRRIALPAFLVEPFTNLTIVGLIWAFSDDTGIAWGGLAALLGVGIARDVAQTRWLRGSFPKLRHWPLSVIKDLFLLPIWFDALVNRRIHWRGHSLWVGRFTRLRRARVSRRLRRRVRRVTRLRTRDA